MIHSAVFDALLWPIVRMRARGLVNLTESHDGMPPAPPLDGVHLYVRVPLGQESGDLPGTGSGLHCPADARRYFAALRHEIGLYHRAGFCFTGVSFGGGISTAEPEELVDTIAMIRTLFPVREISVETKPLDLRPPLLEQLRRNGVSRLSVGVRSFHDARQRGFASGVGLAPGAEDAERIRLATGYFRTLNVDLVFDPPRHRVRDLQRDLAVCRTIGANQVSGFPARPTGISSQGTLATEVASAVRLRGFHEAMADGLAPEFVPTSAWSFSRAPAHGAHLSSALNYVGVGVGAFSYLAGTRHVTCRSLPEYERRVGVGRIAVVGRHRLSARHRARYEVYMGLAWLGYQDPPAFAGEDHGRAVRTELRLLAALGAVRRRARGWEPTVRGRLWLALLREGLLEGVGQAGGAGPQRCPELRHAETAAHRPPSDMRANVSVAR